jgi:hypothetical protein
MCRNVVKMKSTKACMRPLRSSQPVSQSPGWAFSPVRCVGVSKCVCTMNQVPHATSPFVRTHVQYVHCSMAGQLCMYVCMYVVYCAENQPRETEAPRFPTSHYAPVTPKSQSPVQVLQCSQCREHSITVGVTESSSTTTLRSMQVCTATQGEPRMQKHKRGSR